MAKEIVPSEIPTVSLRDGRKVEVKAVEEKVAEEVEEKVEEKVAEEVEEKVVEEKVTIDSRLIKILGVNTVAEAEKAIERINSMSNGLDDILANEDAYQRAQTVLTPKKDLADTTINTLGIPEKIKTSEADYDDDPRIRKMEETINELIESARGPAELTQQVSQQQAQQEEHNAQVLGAAQTFESVGATDSEALSLAKVLISPEGMKEAMGILLANHRKEEKPVEDEEANAQVEKAKELQKRIDLLKQGKVRSAADGAGVSSSFAPQTVVRNGKAVISMRNPTRAPR